MYLVKKTSFFTGRFIFFITDFLDSYVPGGSGESFKFSKFK